MKLKELITQLEKTNKGDSKYTSDISEYLDDLKKRDPNTIVQFSNGDCEDDGVYAPSKDGVIKREGARPFQEGDPFPDDDNDWIRIAYLPKRTQRGRSF